MWSPTHVQVTVQKAKGLITKGKNGTNDAFVTIGLGKEKYQTSVKEKASETVEWHEKCELQIPKQGNTAEITITALHHNFLGVDEFLGYISIPLAGLDVYDRPKNRWYTLKDKPGRDKKKSRGELEVKVAFIVKAGSLADLSKKEKHKSSLGQVSQAFSSSLISISSLDKRKGLKKLASKIGHKIGKNKKDKGHGESENSKGSSQFELNLDNKYRQSQQKAGDADPGVISEGESEDDFTLDDLSHKGSGCSLEIRETNSTPLEESLKNFADNEYRFHPDISVPPNKPPRSTLQAENTFDEWEQKLYGKHGKDGNHLNISPANTLKRRLNGLGSLVASTSDDKITSSNHSSFLNETERENYPPTVQAPKSEPSYSPQRMRQNVFLDKSKEDLPKIDLRSSPTLSTSSKSPLERIIIGGETEKNYTQLTTTSGNSLSLEVLKKFEGKTREDLVEMIIEMQSQILNQNRQQKDLEDYLDNLLLRVMETSPRILQNPYKKKF